MNNPGCNLRVTCRELESRKNDGKSDEILPLPIPSAARIDTPSRLSA